MKALLSFKIVLVLIFSSLSTFSEIVLAETNTSTCENGECVSGIIDRLDDLGKLYRTQCLPQNIQDSKIEKYHESHPLSEDCWKYITEVDHLENLLSEHQSRLELKLGCDSPDCKMPNSSQSLNAQLANLSTVEENISCTEPRKKAVKAQCGQDMDCALVAGALGLGGFIAEQLVPDRIKPKNCNLQNDSCSTQLVTGFLKSIMNFFGGAWDVLKSVGRKTGQKMEEFWNWVQGAEDHSSTAQLALAKASKDPGIFRQLVDDFPGTMKKMWSAFVASMNIWLKESVFCEKWSGVPQFSECLKPSPGFDCISCKAMVNGMCSVSGTILAEVVPAFLSGGLTIALREGVNGAAKIARAFKISQKSLNLIKESRAGKLAIQVSNRADDTLKISRGLKLAKTVVEASLTAIKTYMLSPARRALKVSFTALKSLGRKSKLFLAVTPTGKFIVTSGKVIKRTTEIILYPIDNPITTFGFKAGARTFERVLKLKAPMIANKTTVVLAVTTKTPDIEPLMAQIDLERISGKTNTKEFLKLESELLHRLKPIRLDALKTILLKGDSDLHEIIQRLYPELKYGDLAKILSKERILASEEELYIEISNLPGSPYKGKILQQFKDYFSSGEARSSIVGSNKIPPFTKPEMNKVLSSIKSRPNIKFNLTVEQLDDRYLLRVTNLPEKEAEALADILVNNPRVANGIRQNIILGKNKAILEVVGQGDGTLRVKNISLESAPVYPPKEIEQPINLSGAAARFLAPTFSSVGRNNERELRQKNREEKKNDSDIKKGP